ncbi:MAG: FHA domain-containing protein [Lachnospiraceae bacterium]|nr:FHA domain-containing protein [Lachnospiraceae bacterium]
MEKFKICPVCGMHNKPNMIECLGCETDLTSVKATDEETEKAKNEAQESEVSKSQEEYVRICDCGAVNSATAKKCTECGEDISDIAPTLNEQRSECVFVMTSVDGTYVFEIKEGEVVIGREHEMKEYLMNKPYVSRQHAKLIKEANRVFIENLSGTNYTFVNNQRIAERTELKFDDEIGLGGNEVNGKRQDEAAYLVLRSI